MVDAAKQSERRSVDALLDESRTQIERYTAEEARSYQQQGAWLVDIRPIAQRSQYGQVPDALVIERNVLEWRLDPQCAHRLPEASSYERRIIILCQAGYASSMAAASVRSLGYRHVADVIGGFEAWQQAGLPVSTL